MTFAKKIDSLYTCLSSLQCVQAFYALRALHSNAQPCMFLQLFAMNASANLNKHCTQKCLSTTVLSHLMYLYASTDRRSPRSARQSECTLDMVIVQLIDGSGLKRHQSRHSAAPNSTNMIPCLFAPPYSEPQGIPD
jgi:hypothetical protein